MQPSSSVPARPCSRVAADTASSRPAFPGAAPTRMVRRLLAAVLCGLALLPGPGLAAGPETASLRVVHVNDTHSHLEAMELPLALGASPDRPGNRTLVQVGGYPALISRIAEMRRETREPLLLLHAGDAVQGTLYYTRFRGQADMALLNRMGIDAMALGNHEFDLGPAQVARLAGMANFPFLSANLNATREPALAPVLDCGATTPDSPGPGGCIRPFLVRETPAGRVGVIGLTTALTAEISNAGPTVRFEDEAASLGRAVAALSGQGVDKIVALTHVGYERDLELARSVPGLDLIVGGHTHTRLGNFTNVGLDCDGAYPTLATGPDGRTVCVVQAWEWGKVLGDVSVGFDAAGDVTRCQGRPVMVLSGPLARQEGQGPRRELAGRDLESARRIVDAAPNLAVVREDGPALADLSGYRAELDQYRRQTVAVAAADLVREKELSSRPQGRGLRPEQVRGVGTLVARSMLWKLQATGAGARFVLQNMGAARIDLNRGNVTVAQVRELLPFGNTLIVLDMQGADVRRVLERSLLRGWSDRLGLAGIRMRTAPGENGAFRLESVDVADGAGGWTPLDDAALYRLGTNSYLAGGGSGYDLLRDRASFRSDTGFGDAEVFLEYAGAVGTLVLPPE